jgi:hypothetical protein
MRKLFVQLVLKTEPRGTSIWTITGTEQAMIRKSGSLRHEGRYLLNSVAKKWERGYLAATSLSAKEMQGLVDTYFCRTEEFLAYSSNRAVLEELLPNSEVMPWHYDSEVTR